ncbi:Mitochondrial carrier-like protein 1 [Sciurus carolinensis]|uniref:Mitochondrial carrier-like protein 1 n=1 Tax=Sciurus carolinensis TaxID=30640 RepID=A0AA41MLU9_SCICA|nr:Mitochondrial carrier-like protein 1 [Sciurus carolinensis]
MDGASGGLGSGDNAPTTEALFVALGPGVTALSHPLLYVKLLIQHEEGFPSRRDRAGLQQGSSNKDDMKTSLKKVVKETSYEMMIQCVSRMLADPLPVISMRCMVQFVRREAKYSGVLSSIGKIFKEEGLLGFFVGLIPPLLGDVVFLWGCNLLAHFINAYLVDDSFSQALAIRSYAKFVMGIAVSMLTYPFLLVGDLMAVNNCGLQLGSPPTPQCSNPGFTVGST